MANKKTKTKTNKKNTKGTNQNTKNTKTVKVSRNDVSDFLNDIEASIQNLAFAVTDKAVTGAKWPTDESVDKTVIVVRKAVNKAVKDSVTGLTVDVETQTF